MEKSKYHHSITGKSTCQTITLSKGKKDECSWQSSTLTTCLPPAGSIICDIYDEHQNILMGNNMMPSPSVANRAIPQSENPITTPYLPTEIIHSIISHSDDLQSLKNWALVSWKYNDIAERILWSNITINTSQFYDPAYPLDGQDPLQILRYESLERRMKRHLRPTWMEMDRRDYRIPSIVSRLPMIKHFALRTVWDIDSRDLPQSGSREDWRILEVYQELFPAMQNLCSLRIDGEVNRRTWDLLLVLPSLRELRIWRTTTVDSQALLERCYSQGSMNRFSQREKQKLVEDMVLNFEGLSRLRIFEIGLLSPIESAALGSEVRKSNLEVLHIAVTRDNKSYDNQGMHTLSRFWENLVPNEIDENSPIAQDLDYGFPASMRELVLEDDAHRDIAPAKIVKQSLRRCRENLTRFYFDFLDEPLLASVLQSSTKASPLFPRLTHLHLPWVQSERHEFDHPRTMSKIMTAFIESHKSTLQVFQLLNAAEDSRLLKYENPLNKALKEWMSIKEIRLDSEHTADHYSNVPRGQEWTRPADFLSVDGGGYWGEDLRRARLDRFDLTNIEIGFKSYRAWHNIKVLVLNPRLLWNYCLLQDPHDISSPRLRKIDRDHLLGMKHFAESECENKELAERISRKMGPNLRVLSIRECRFWIERYGGPIWHFGDALADPEQRRQMNRILDQRDWDFLSERSTTDTQEAANTATFLRNDMYSPVQPVTEPVTRPISPTSIISDAISESESSSEDEDEVMDSETENEDEDRFEPMAAEMDGDTEINLRTPTYLPPPDMDSSLDVDVDGDGDLFMFLLPSEMPWNVLSSPQSQSAVFY